MHVNTYSFQSLFYSIADQHRLTMTLCFRLLLFYPYWNNFGLHGWLCGASIGVMRVLPMAFRFKYLDLPKYLCAGEFFHNSYCLVFMQEYLLLFCVFSAVVGATADYNETFVEIASLEDEDSKGLRGLSYNETQPPVTSPNEFASKTTV